MKEFIQYIFTFGFMLFFLFAIFNIVVRKNTEINELVLWEEEYLRFSSTWFFMLLLLGFELLVIIIVINLFYSKGFTDIRIFVFSFLGWAILGCVWLFDNVIGYIYDDK